MTAPDGEAFSGWWRITEVDAPHMLAFVDCFGEPESESDLPATSTRVTITQDGAGTTQMVLVGTSPSHEALEQLMAMGMVEGLGSAVEQSFALLDGA